MNIQKLTTLAVMLETDEVVKRHFNLGTWMNECKTIGCAYGWWCERGPGPKDTKWHHSSRVPVLTYVPLDWGCQSPPSGHRAAAYEFDITPDQAFRLFDPVAYGVMPGTAHDVAQRVRKLITEQV